MTLYLGVDPGATGALAVVDSYGALHEVHDMPLVDKKVSPILLAELVNEFADYEEQTTHCVVEQVASMPGQGVASTFTFGQSYGIVLGVIAAVGLPVTHVRPAAWKKTMGVTADKETSRRRALDLWPNRADWFKRKKDNGRAEAALLALWLYQKTAP